MSYFLKNKRPQLDCESSTDPLLANDSEDSQDCKYDGGFNEDDRKCWKCIVWVGVFLLQVIFFAGL